MFNKNINNNQINSMLNMAGKKMGTNPEELKKKLEEGNLNDIVKNMSPNQAETLNNILSNPKAIEQIMNSKQAQELLKKLSGGK